MSGYEDFYYADRLDAKLRRTGANDLDVSQYNGESIRLLWANWKEADTELRELKQALRVVFAAMK